MDLMNEYIEAADKSIADLIEELCDEYKRRSTHDDELLERICKLRASMNPTIIQKIQQ